jgi:hypothetical protein
LFEFRFIINDTIKRTATITIKRASHVGKPLRCNQNNGGALMIAINAANRNGTRITLAALMPATTTTKAAIVNKI